MNFRSSRLVKIKILQAVLLVVFISPLLCYWIYSIWLNPSRNFYTNDAEFPYFINSLAVFKGQGYRYVDHPGTPLEVIGTVFLGVSYPFIASASQSFVAYQLAHPDFFLNFAHYFLIAVNLLCIYAFFSIALSHSGWKNIIYSAALSTAYFAIHPSSLSTSMIWNHNSFNFPFGTIILLVLYKYIAREENQNNLSAIRLIGLGMATGILASITIYMAGWAVGVMVTVFAYHLLKKTIWTKAVLLTSITGISAIVGFFVSVLPVINRMPYFRNWILSLFTHQSSYLAVPKDQPMLQRLAENIAIFYNMLPILFISLIALLVISIIVFLLYRKRFLEKPGLWAIVIGLFIQSLVILLSFLDRPLRDMYFLSLAAILPVWLMALLEIMEYSSAFAKTLKTCVSILILIGIINVSIESLALRRNEIASLSESEKVISNAVFVYANQAKRRPDNIMVLWMYGSPSPCWGLWLGNSKAGNAFDNEIEKICPHQYLLADGLSVSIPNSNSHLNEIRWDVIFACQRNETKLKNYDPKINIEEHPELNWMCGKAIVAFNDK